MLADGRLDGSPSLLAGRGGAERGQAARARAQPGPAGKRAGGKRDRGREWRTGRGGGAGQVQPKAGAAYWGENLGERGSRGEAISHADGP